MTIDQFERLTDRIEADDRAGVVRMTDEILASMEEARNLESGLDTLAQKTRKETSDESQAYSTAEDYLNTVISAEQSRGSASGAVASYLARELSAKEASAEVKQATADERKLRNAKENLRTAIEGIETDPALVLHGDDSIELLKGETLAAEYSLQNLGTTVGKNLEVEIQSNVDLTVESAADSVPSQGDVTIVVADEGTPLTGDVSATLTCSVESDVEVFQLEVQVLSKADLISSARVSLEELASTIEAAADRFDDTSSKSQRGNKNGSTKGLVDKIHTIVKRLEKLERQLSSNRPAKSIDNEIQSVINELGAVLNHLDAKEGQLISEGDSALISDQVAGIIDELSLARKANR